MKQEKQEQKEKDTERQSEKEKVRENSRIFNIYMLCFVMDLLTMLCMQSIMTIIQSQGIKIRANSFYAKLPRSTDA